MEILKESKELFDYLVKARRQFHENPELSGEEWETLKYIRNELDDMGIEYVEVEDGGIVGLIHGAKPGKTLLLRADVDALPIMENPKNLKGDKVSVSKIPGVSHACGHDAHAAMLLGEAKLLNAHKDELNGTIVLCFERGEEGGGQIQQLLPYIDEQMGLSIDGCMATHVKWDVPAGQVSVEPGAVIAGGIGFGIRLRGCAGHGSRPDMAHSALDCFNAIYNHMNMIRMKHVHPADILTFSVGTVQCGTAFNIIPDELTFAGSLRTYNVEGAGIPFMKQFMDVVEAECKLFGCTYEVLNTKEPLFECYNNPACSALAKEAVKKHLGEEALCVAEPWMACESYQAFLKWWPGVITFTGICSEESGAGANHHTPEFDVDEKGMIYGVAAAVAYAVEFLNNEKEIPFKRFDGTLKSLVSRNLN